MLQKNGSRWHFLNFENSSGINVNVLQISPQNFTGFLSGQQPAPKSWHGPFMLVLMFGLMLCSFLARSFNLICFFLSMFCHGVFLFFSFNRFFPYVYRIFFASHTCLSESCLASGLFFLFSLHTCSLLAACKSYLSLSCYLPFRFLLD